MPRKCRVVTTTQQGRGGPTVEANRERMLDVLDLACGEKPDLVCLPENFLRSHVSVDKAAVAEPLDGPTLGACAKRAKDHATYVVCPLLTKRDGKIFNSSVLLDRRGGVAGVYDKVQPVTSRADFTCFEGGVTPGRAAPVFETDFGRVGLQICFDLGFPETWAQLKQANAELVIWSSAYDGGFPLRVFACLHHYYVVSSVRTTHAYFINPMGAVLERTGPQYPLATRVLDLDFMVCHYDFHVKVPEAMKRKYGAGVTVRAYSEEGHFLVESNRDDLPLARLAEEFGLERADAYHQRHREPLARLREDRAPEPQQPPYHNRPQYG